MLSWFIDLAKNIGAELVGLNEDGGKEVVDYLLEKVDELQAAAIKAASSKEYQKEDRE